MDTDVLTSMYAQIVRGGSKAESQFVTDDESSAMWDQVAGEVDQMRTSGVTFDIPNETPGRPGTPVADPLPPGAMKPENKPAPPSPTEPEPGAEEPPGKPPEEPADEKPGKPKKGVNPFPPTGDEKQKPDEEEK